MAERPRGYGLTAELQGKMNAKYDTNLEQDARSWMQAMTGEPLSNEQVGSQYFQESLKDGTYLCKLANSLGGNLKFNTSKMAFKQMENIGKFLDFCNSFGVPKTDTFQTVDLYEGQNMASVLSGILALGRKAGSKGFQGIGPKEAQQNVREFSEEQLRSGQNVIGLQMGSNKGASQSGQNFGKTRSIMD